MQCPKALYLSIHRPELKAAVSASQQAVMDQGTRVGEEARKRFPGGVLIDTDYRDQSKALALTAQAIKDGTKVLFEATFEHQGVLAKIDVLERESKRSSWNLIEVKSATSVKEEHLSDVAIQKLVAEGAGLKFKSAALMHINNKCVAPDLSNLFAQENITSEVNAQLEQVSKSIAELKKLLTKGEPPSLDIGPHCDSPYECPFKEHCWKGKVPSPGVFDFPNMKTKGWKFYEKGIVKLDDPRLGPFKGTDLKRIEAVRTGKRWVDKKAIQKALGEWKWPLYYLDFETIGFAIPRYNGTRPYQQIPFQFSLHVQPAPGAPLVHLEYLHDSDTDPREQLALKLIESIGSTGSLVAYNASFEAGVMRALAEAYPKFAKKLSTFVDRLVDPLPVFRSSVYDVRFLGSFSIKAVAPALLGGGSSYKGLAVADGEAAQRAYLEMTDSCTPGKRKQELRASLIEYCRKDTAEMVALVNWLLVAAE